jgi:hypothetical protein
VPGPFLERIGRLIDIYQRSTLQAPTACPESAWGESPRKGSNPPDFQPQRGGMEGRGLTDLYMVSDMLRDTLVRHEDLESASQRRGDWHICRPFRAQAPRVALLSWGFRPRLATDAPPALAVESDPLQGPAPTAAPTHPMWLSRFTLREPSTKSRQVRSAPDRGV